MINQNYSLDPLLAQNVCCIFDVTQHITQLKTRIWGMFTSCVCDSNLTSNNVDHTAGIIPSVCISEKKKKKNNSSCGNE